MMYCSSLGFFCSGECGVIFAGMVVVFRVFYSFEVF